MAKKMIAIRKMERDVGADLVEIDIPIPGPNDILVKVHATSICGTDVHIYNWDKWSQNRINNVPQTLGHELAGEVVEVGSQVRKLKKGDFVSSETHIPCDTCIQCLTGQRHICNNLKILGVDMDGCFAEYCIIPEIVAWKNDPSISHDFASVMEPLGNAVYCTLAEPVAGKTVAISGDGPTSLFAAGVARVSGAVQIYHIGMEPARLEIAKKMGADITINIKDENPVEKILALTDGVGVDVVLEMAGAAKAVETGFKILRKGGRFSAFGIVPDSVTIDYNNAIVFKGSTIDGINGRLMWDTWVKVTNFLKFKRLDISPVITHKLPLKDYKEGFKLMTGEPKTCGKVVLIP